MIGRDLIGESSRVCDSNFFYDSPVLGGFGDSYIRNVPGTAVYGLRDNGTSKANTSPGPSLTARSGATPSRRSPRCSGEVGEDEHHASQGWWSGVGPRAQLGQTLAPSDACTAPS